MTSFTTNTAIECLSVPELTPTKLSISGQKTRNSYSTFYSKDLLSQFICDFNKITSDLPHQNLTE